MGLKGQLEDLPLTDILQVVAFAKKTGRLTIECCFGRGAILFRHGLVVHAQSWSTLPFFEKHWTEKGAGLDESLFREQIEIALRELARLREGRFQFELTESVIPLLGGRDISKLILHDGVDAQHLLLDLARQMDEERRDTSALLELGAGSLAEVSEPPSTKPARAATAGLPPRGEQTAGERVRRLRRPAAAPSPPLRDAKDETTVVVVDDEAMVTDVMSEEFRTAGYHVVTASGPAEGSKLVRKCAKTGSVLMVADLRMPTSSGASFWGGFELVRRIKKAGLCVPVVLMAESLTSKARTRARQLGIRRVAYKPALSKLDESQYRADLKAFSSSLLNLLRDAEPLEVSDVETPVRDVEVEEDGKLLLEFLNSMTEQLVSPNRSTDISRMILQVAQRYLDRAIWFLIKQDRACGLAGFGLAPTERESSELARKLSFNVSDVEAFREVIDLRKSRLFGRGANGLGRKIHAVVGIGRSREWTLVPMLSNGEVVAVLYGDNAKSGAPIAALKGLELFVAHAGIAMENVFLNRKLRSFEQKLSDRRNQEVRERASTG